MSLSERIRFEISLVKMINLSILFVSNRLFAFLIAFISNHLLKYAAEYIRSWVIKSAAHIVQPGTALVISRLDVIWEPNTYICFLIVLLCLLCCCSSYRIFCNYRQTFWYVRRADYKDICSNFRWGLVSISANTRSKNGLYLWFFMQPKRIWSIPRLSFSSHFSTCFSYCDHT